MPLRPTGLEAAAARRNHVVSVWCLACTRAGDGFGGANDKRANDKRANDRVGILVRAAIAIVAGGAATNWISAHGWPERALDGWGVGAGTFVLLTWFYMFRLKPPEVKAHGGGVGRTHHFVGAVVVFCAILSLGAVGEILRATSQSGPAALRPTLTGLFGVAVSWLAVHTVFMVRYADIFFTHGESGIDFPGQNEDGQNEGGNKNGSGDLRYTDFAYVAFTIGMAYAVSDTSLTSHKMRKLALLHSGVSYLFGAVILAATVNLIVGLDFWHSGSVAKP
jgi:uncharacterized membrane protein